MKPVESGCFRSVGHDPESETMRIEFHDGSVYEYTGVTAEKLEALMGASSLGRHFQKHIRGQHDTRKVA